jgi:hypothetical protein
VAVLATAEFQPDVISAGRFAASQAPASAVADFDRSVTQTMRIQHN